MARQVWYYVPIGIKLFALDTKFFSISNLTVIPGYEGGYILHVCVRGILRHQYKYETWEQVENFVTTHDLVEE